MDSCRQGSHVSPVMRWRPRQNYWAEGGCLTDNKADCQADDTHRDFEPTRDQGVLSRIPGGPLRTMANHSRLPQSSPEVFAVLSHDLSSQSRTEWRDRCKPHRFKQAGRILCNWLPPPLRPHHCILGRSGSAAQCSLTIRESYRIPSIMAGSPCIYSPASQPRL